MDDPQGCVAKCTKDESNALVNVSLQLAAKIIQDIPNVKPAADDSDAEQAAFKKRIEDMTYSHMGPMFADSCT